MNKIINASKSARSGKQEGLTTKPFMALEGVVINGVKMHAPSPRVEKSKKVAESNNNGKQNKEK